MKFARYMYGIWEILPCEELLSILFKVTRLFFSQATDRDAGNFSAVQYRISSGNDGGFFKIDENTGFITTASNFKGKKGEQFTIKVSAYDNHGKAPTNEADGEATAQVVIGQVCYNVFFIILSVFSLGST